MLRIIVISCFMLVSSGVEGRRTSLKSNLRVFDGRDITFGEYPYAVVLLYIIETRFGKLARRICTASVISEHWTLTAAHCVALSDIHVWYGNFTVPPLETKLYSKVLQIIIHPSYRKLRDWIEGITLDIENDISLLRTQGIIVESYGRLSAVDHTTMIGLPVTYVGGGLTNKPGDDQLRQLQVGEAAIIKCDEEFKEHTRYLICVTAKCSNRLNMGWKGDSGGPLVQDSKIIGVFSIGRINGDMGFTPINSNIDWISNVMLSTA